jgi:5-methylcytosine-specific restriction endonuclease McrA
MLKEIACPSCGETEELAGDRVDSAITMRCDVCGERWERDLTPECQSCGSKDLVTVPHAIVEKSRGTQLSVVGTRLINLCSTCDAESIEQWQRNRPNPLLPRVLPTVGDVDDVLSE